MAARKRQRGPVVADGRTIVDIVRGGFTESGEAIFFTIRLAGGGMETYFCDRALAKRLRVVLDELERAARRARPRSKR